MKRAPLKPGAKSLSRGSTFSSSGLGRGAPKRKPFAASPAQRAKVKGQVCAVCHAEHVDAAHLIDRSLGGDDDPRAVVGLCRRCHDAYDTGRLSLVEHLEPHYREEVAYAVMTVGIVRALERLTNERWAPVEGSRNAA